MDKSRQQFEYWYFNNHSHEQKYPLHKDESGEYFYDGARKAWVSWQASRESLINNLEPVGYMRLEGCDNIKEYGFTHIYEEKFDKETIPLYKLD